MAHVNNQVIEDIYINAIPNGTVIPDPPKYDDICQTPYIISSHDIPPPQYVQPISYLQAQSQTQQQPSEIEIRELRYEKLHKIYGVLSIVFGGCVMILDPLLPAIYGYFYSLFPAGIFMVISGICSIHGSRKRNKCSLVASLVFNIFTILLLFVAYIMGLVATASPSASQTCYSWYCVPNESFYVNGVRGLGVFNTIWGLLLFVLLIWDSTLKCGTVCCKIRQHNNVIYNTNNPTVNPILIVQNVNNQ